MLTNTKITLFETPTILSNARPLSPFSSLVRCALNYRKLSFKTKFVYYQDIQSLGEKIGAKTTASNPDGSPKWTLPIIIDETSGTPVVVSDSFDIIQYLEATYPDPERPLFSSSSTQTIDLFAVSSFTEIVFPLLRDVLLPFTLNLLVESDRAWWIRDRLGGKSIESVTFAKGSKEYDEILDNAKKGLKKVAGYFREKPQGGSSGSWFGGERPVYVDFAIVAFLNIVRLVNTELWTDLAVDVDGGRFVKLVEAAEVYAGFEVAE